MNSFLPYSRQCIEDDDIQAVLKALKGEYLTTGPAVEAFEKELAAKVGARFAVAVCNGTAALHCAVMALRLPKGSLGITSPNTFVASSNALLFESHRVGFCDIESKSGNVDPDLLEDRMNLDSPGVVIPVHFAGQPCEMNHISAIARKKGIAIIEDASHALGSRYAEGSLVGSCCYSDLTTFSFHPVKNITCGEGGAITTNDEMLYERLLQARSHGIVRKPEQFQIQSQAFDDHSPDRVNPWYYEMVSLGYNYRLTDFQAALASSQLAKVERFAEKRRSLVAAYAEQLNGISGLSLLGEQGQGYSAFHLCVVLVDFQFFGKSRGVVMEELRELGIGTQVHYIPVHFQPYYRSHFDESDVSFPAAETYYEQCLSIPLYPQMEAQDVSRVVAGIRSVLGVKG